MPTYLNSKKHGNPLSEFEREYIKDNRHTMSPWDMAKALDRQKASGVSAYVKMLDRYEKGLPHIRKAAKEPKPKVTRKKISVSSTNPPVKANLDNTKYRGRQYYFRTPKGLALHRDLTIGEQNFLYDNYLPKGLAYCRDTLKLSNSVVSNAALKLGLQRARGDNGTPKPVITVKPVNRVVPYKKVTASYSAPVAEPTKSNAGSYAIVSILLLVIAIGGLYLVRHP